MYWFLYPALKYLYILMSHFSEPCASQTKQLCMQAEFKHLVTVSVDALRSFALDSLEPWGIRHCYCPNDTGICGRPKLNRAGCSIVLMGQRVPNPHFIVKLTWYRDTEWIEQWTPVCHPPKSISCYYLPMHTPPSYRHTLVLKHSFLFILSTSTSNFLRMRTVSYTAVILWSPLSKRGHSHFYWLSQECLSVCPQYSITYLL